MNGIFQCTNPLDCPALLSFSASGSPSWRCESLSSAHSPSVCVCTLWPPSCKKHKQHGQHTTLTGSGALGPPANTHAHVTIFHTWDNTTMQLSSYRILRAVARHCVKSTFANLWQLCKRYSLHLVFGL